MLRKRLKVPIGVFPKNSKVIFRDNYVTIRSSANSLAFSRLGVVFKAKSFKTASLRNKLRRAVFNAFRGSPLLGTGPTTGRDILIMLDPAISAAGQSELKTILEKYARNI